MALLRNSRKERNGVIVKCIALCADTMKPRTVLKAIRAGSDHEICTQQEVKKGDVVILSNNVIKTNTSTVDVLHVDRVTRDMTYMSKITALTVDMNANNTTFNWLDLFHTVDNELLSWLTHANESMLLPDGYGWTGGQTRYEEAKMREFNILLKDVDSNIRSELVEYAMVSPRSNVNHQWATAQSIPRDPITLPPSKNIVAHFTILWTTTGTEYRYYDNEDFSKEYLYVDTLIGNRVKKALVGTVIRNKHGNNVRWKLYT